MNSRGVLLIIFLVLKNLFDIIIVLLQISSFKPNTDIVYSPELMSNSHTEHK